MRGMCGLSLFLSEFENSAIVSAIVTGTKVLITTEIELAINLTYNNSDFQANKISFR